MMAFCIKCGKELAGGANFCANCGSTIDSKSIEQRKTIYDGDLHKCPKCGEHLNAFVTKCPVCNYELRGSQASSCVHELAQKLEKTETYEQKEELISNFYIPNTKEDIYEFFILAYSYISTGSYDADIWLVKLEQAYLKAKLAFGEGSEYDYIKELYEKINDPSKKIKTRKTKNVLAIFLFITGLIFSLGMLLAQLIINSLPINNVYISFDEIIFIIIIGIVCFILGLFMLISPERKRKRKSKK